MVDKTQMRGLAVERRTARRFPIQQDALYRILDHKTAAPERGAGRTVNISSGGVMFETERQLRPGKRLELSVNWPATLDGRCRLKFVAYGRVVRTTEHHAAMHIEQYEFRTRRTSDLEALIGKPAGSPVPYH